MKNRHETRRGIVYKNRHHAELLADELEVELEVEEALTRRLDEPDYDELAEIAEMADFAQRGLRSC